MTNALARKSSDEIAVTDNEVQYENVGQMLMMAETVLQSGLATSFKTPQQIIVAWQYAKALKLAPMAALTSIAVINGKPSLYGAALPGVATSSGQVASWKEWFEGEGDNLKAFCKVGRKGIDGELTGEFSLIDAKRAGLSGQNWAKYPKDMLMWKARARAFRPLFGDVLCGMPVYEDLLGHEPDKRPLTGSVSIVDPLQESGKVENAKESPTVKESENTGLQDVAADRSAIDGDRESCETIIFAEARARKLPDGSKAGWTLVGLLQSAEGGAVEYKTTDEAHVKKASETKGQKMKVWTDSEGWIKDLEIA